MVTEGILKSDVILRQMNSSKLAENKIEIEEHISLLIFQLESYFFAFRASEAREILPFMGVTWIPGASAQLPGVINVHGDVAAVLDLRETLKIAKTKASAEGGFCIMVRAGDGRGGILVDNIVDIADIPVLEIGQVLPGLDERFQRFALNQFAYHSKMVIVLSAAQIVGIYGGAESGEK